MKLISDKEAFEMMPPHVREDTIRSLSSIFSLLSAPLLKVLYNIYQVKKHAFWTINWKTIEHLQTLLLSFHEILQKQIFQEKNVE